MGNLCLFSPIYNEAKNLPQWLAHHINMGVEFFYLANHRSTDNWREAIEPFMDIIHVEECPEENLWPHRKVEVCNWMIGKFRWVGYIDIDEYLIPEEYGDTVAGLLEHRYHDLPAVGVHWLTFGANNHVTRPKDKLLVEAYTTRPPNDFGANGHIKSIVDPNEPQCWPNPHINTAVLTRDTERGVVPDATQGVITHKHLSLNHYYTKSLEEWTAKAARHSWDGTRRGFDEFHRCQSQQVVDTHATEYAEDIRATMRRMGCRDIPGETR